MTARRDSCFLLAFVALHAVVSAIVNFGAMRAGMAWWVAGRPLPRPASLAALETASRVMGYPASDWLFGLVQRYGAPRFLGDYSLMLLLILVNSALAWLCVWAAWLALRWAKGRPGARRENPRNGADPLE